MSTRTGVGRRRGRDHTTATAVGQRVDAGPGRSLQSFASQAFIAVTRPLGAPTHNASRSENGSAHLVLPEGIERTGRSAAGPVRGCRRAAVGPQMSSLAECFSLGHQHPRVSETVRAQAAKRCFVTSARGAKPRARLAEVLLEKSAFEGGRVFFTLRGADANERAVKFSRQAGDPPQGWVITRERYYHGATYGAMAVSGDAGTASQVDPAPPRVVHVPPPHAYRCPFGCPSAEACGIAAAEQVSAVIDVKPREWRQC